MAVGVGECARRAARWTLGPALGLALAAGISAAFAQPDALEDGGGRASADAGPARLAEPDKARLLLRSEALADTAAPGGGPALEDVMSRDRIIEEFDIFGADKPVPAVPARPATAVPAPRTRPVDPGVLRFRPIKRIRQMVRPELFAHFDLYLYVNKAPEGVWAQNMFVYARRPDGTFELLFRWRVSTGREQNERYFTTTPIGVFKLDPDRFREYYRSTQWDGAYMPFAMFIDFSYATRKSGIAIHGTRGTTEDRLGYRSSGGCIRLAEDNARMLFYLVRTRYGGMVPEFAFDRALGQTSKTGDLVRDAKGEPVLKPGYRALLIVDYVTE